MEELLMDARFTHAATSSTQKLMSTYLVNLRVSYCIQIVNIF